MAEQTHFGLHYFPDALHYRQFDLETWLPELVGMGASWLVLQAPVERAIPESFLAGLLQAGIQPLLHFDLPLGSALDLNALRLLFRSYASWGIRQVILFDRPNLRAAWPAAAWMQSDLVERFLDAYLPAAELAQAHDLLPVFPPLLPGGDYWDLAFLRAALRSIKRRQSGRWWDRFALAAYAASNDRPPDWGAGGHLRWPGARPYLAQPGMQDQRGVHIYEWYLPVCQEELGRSLPVYLLGLGSYGGDAPRWPGGSVELDESLQARRTLAILEHLLPASEGQPDPALPDEVQAACFWLLAAEAHSPYAAQAWFQVDKSGACPRPIAQMARRWANRKNLAGVEKSAGSVERSQALLACSGMPGEGQAIRSAQGDLGGARYPITHYILLPLYAWGAAQWDLAHIAPLLDEAHPTIGFSLQEASLASRVTVVGGEGTFSSQALDFLRQAGCKVELLDALPAPAAGAGMFVATQESSSHLDSLSSPICDEVTHDPEH